MSLLEEVHAIMEQICVHYINETFMRFPMFISEVTDAALTILTQDKERARLLMSEIIDANIGYMYTKDPEYIAVILPSSEKEKLEKQREKEKKVAEEKAKEAERNRSEANLQDGNAKQGAAKQPPKDSGDKEDDAADDADSPTVKMSKDKAQKAMEKVLIKEMRIRIDTYFRVVVTQLADMIPKLIGHNLVNAGVNSLQFSVFKKISSGSVSDMLKEPEHIVKKRETLKRMLDTLTASRKILLRDPDLAYSLDVKSSSEFLEMREKDKARKLTAAKEKKKSLMEKASEAMSDLGKSIKSGAQAVQNKFASDPKANTSTSTQQSSQNVTTKSTPFGEIKVVETPKTASTNVGNSKPFIQKTDAELAKDAASLAWQHKETIVKVAKENPELVEKGVRVATQAVDTQPASTAEDPKKTRLKGLFGF
jgi:dynamin 1-like protein